MREKIAEGSATRQDFYISYKFWCSYHRKVEEACMKAIKELGVDYIDLFSIHYPFSLVYKDDQTLWPANDDDLDDDVDYLDVWREMEKLVEKGLVRSLGVSNFNVEQLERLIKNSKIKPVLNEIENHPGWSANRTIEFCKKNKVIVAGACPLGRFVAEKSFFTDEKVLEIAKKYGKTPYQIVLRYSVELGVIPIPRSSNKNRMAENFDIFDFSLTDKEIAHLASFKDPSNRIIKCLPCANSKYFPFNVEF
jgi:aldehyde reductase